MAVDRKLDRHGGERGQHIRIPADLWKRFGDAVGERNRTPTMRDLVAWFLGEGPAPARRESRQTRAASRAVAGTVLSGMGQGGRPPIP